METYIPSCSRVCKSTSPLVPPKLMLSTDGQQLPGSLPASLMLFTVMSLRFASRPASIFSLMAAILSASFFMSAAAISAAIPRPAMAGTFSVPDLLPCSWPPPTMNGGMLMFLPPGVLPFLIISAPEPLGPCILWPLRDMRSASRGSSILPKL